MKKLSLKEARRIAHEVACWVIYEIVTGGMLVTKNMALQSSVEWYIHGGNHDLGGWCWFTSSVLARVLAARGHETYIVVDVGHCHGFITTKCGVLIDATAMQFGAISPIVQRVSPLSALVHLGSSHRLWRSHITSPLTQWRAANRILRRMGAIA